MLEMEMDLEQPTSSVGDDVTIKQEPVEVKTRIIPKQEIEYITVEVEPLVEAEAHLSLKQEIEYISVKEDPPSLLKLEGYDIHGSSQDPLSITTEECSPPEAYLKPSTSSINKTELEEAEGEDAGEDDWEEIKHEGEPTSDVSYPESAVLHGDGDNTGTGDSQSLATTQEAYRDNECGVSRQWYWCSICKKTFAQFKDLKEHTGVSCHEPLHSFSATGSSVLKQLLQHHTGEPQYRCDVCDKRFKYMSYLEEHLRKHRCKRCGRLFKNGAALRTHLKVHVVERQHHCNIFKKKFNWASDFRKHYSDEHSDERPFSCDECYRTFTSQRGLTLHSHLHSRNEPS